MRVTFRAAAALLLCVLLASCSAPAGTPAAVSVYVAETEGVCVLDNGRETAPGEDVSFRLVLDPGCVIVGTDFDGRWSVAEQGGYTVLTLSGVRFPTRVTLQTQQADPGARYIRTVTYHPNGGEGESFSVTHSVLTHLRPNTAQGGFSRDGHTLVGWNTRPDGSGQGVGLGSRVTVPREGLTLYAQWAPWADEGCFTWEAAGEAGVTITGYSGRGDTLVIPARLGGQAVTVLAAGAFRQCAARAVVLPPGLSAVEDGAFAAAAVEELTLFDDVGAIGDGAFAGCQALQTLRINAATDPYGCSYRRESLLADKADLLITAQGSPKLVFYGGCATWYNLIGSEAARRFPGYQVINMGLNGTVNSLVQMAVIGQYLEEGDILFHAPELSSAQQLLTDTRMYEGDDKLWCGLEYNYDLFALVDIRGMDGVLDSLSRYLGKKQPGGSYLDQYRDASGVSYMDATGSIPLIRTQGMSRLDDTVTLDPDCLADGLPTLAEVYRSYLAKGVRVYVSYACVDMDGLPEDQRGNVAAMDARFRQVIGAMDGPVLISDLSDYLFTGQDFYDTHYHLLTQAAYRNTELWLRDLEAQMERDGLLP